MKSRYALKRNNKIRSVLRDFPRFSRVRRWRITINVKIEFCQYSSGEIQRKTIRVPPKTNSVFSMKKKK